MTNLLQRCPTAPNRSAVKSTSAGRIGCCWGGSRKVWRRSKTTRSNTIAVFCSGPCLIQTSSKLNTMRYLIPQGIIHINLGTPEAIAFIHLPKTGGSTLYDLLSGCFPPDRICPQHFDALHLYSPAELTRYDLYQGHIDYFSLRFIPRRRVRCLSIFRDPVRRLISWYRYSKSHPPSDEFADDINIKLANELSAEEYFEHEIITSSTYNNNAYLFFFSSLHDRNALDALDNDAMHSAARTAEDCPMVGEVLADDDLAGRALAQAAHKILKLDAIGLTERFQELGATPQPSDFRFPKTLLLSGSPMNCRIPMCASRAYRRCR